MSKTTKLLHIDASILGGHSVSRQLSAAVVERLRRTLPDIEVTYRDIGSAPPSHLSEAHLAAIQGAAVDTAALARDLAESRAVLDEFLEADIVVIGAPMYNFTVPSQLKAWIDRILVPGKTFQYSANGVEGLAGGKRVIAVVSRGGFYGPDTPAAAGEHLDTYLRWVFGFIGITAPEIIIAEGIRVSPEQRERALSGALDTVGRLQALPQVA
ncbi:MAG: FMN-dependent NADH-azoreductase [Pseudomonadota bacterium]